MVPYESRANGDIMEYEVLGFPSDEPTLTLNWRQFSYAGKFEMSNTGKAVLKEAGEIVAAAAFNADRDRSTQGWIRYLTVRNDWQGKSLGPKLVGCVTETLLDREYNQITIAVNNPIAYRALYKAGFHFTGEKTGIAELILSYPGQRTLESYVDGLKRFEDRQLPESQESLLADWLAETSVPEIVDDIPLDPSDQSVHDGAR